MALTINQRPTQYTPGECDQIFEATSTATANSDFRYRIVATDVITGTSQTYNIPAWPTSGELTWDAKVFTRKFLKNYVPNNTYNWERCTDAIRRIRINIGEYYGSTYYPGTNYEYYIWNATERALDWLDYNQNDYVYNSNTENLKYISSLTPTTGKYMRDADTFSDRSHFIYVLTSDAGDFETLRVKTYDSAGTLLGTSDIANVYESSFTYTDKYLCIDVGHKGLSQIDSGSVTGTYPIITSSVSYYEVYDYTHTGSPPVAILDPYLLKTITIRCETTYTVYTVHYKAKGGNFETLHFSKNSELTERVEKPSFRLNPKVISSNQFKYTKKTQWEKTISSTGTESLNIFTDWMTPEEIDGHRDLISSKEVYIDYGSTIGLVPVKVLTSEILINESYNNKLFGINLQCEFTYRNNY